MRNSRFTAILVTAVLAGASALVLVPATSVGAATVSTEAELRTAFATDSSVVLANDITLTDCVERDVDRNSPNDGPVTVDGQGHTVTQTCPDRVFDINSESISTWRNVTVTGGRTNDDGGGLESEADHTTLENATFTGNFACSDSGGVHLEDGGLTLVNSTLSNNTARDEGGASEIEGGGAGDNRLTAVNSTISGNSSFNDGALNPDEGGSLVYVTLVGNTNLLDKPTCAGSLAADEDAASDEEPGPSVKDADEPANLFSFLDEGETISFFGTVIALPTDGPNCAIESDPVSPIPPTSSGYNFSDDATCGFTNTAAGDRETAGDPGLGALASNGGPTQTRLPAATSPLLNFIPLASCQADGAAGVTTDQRGISRPQGPGCEIGSVEVEVAAAVEIVIRFTG